MQLYDSPAFELSYRYSGSDLGLTYEKDRCRFRLWAPTAQAVSLQLYAGGTDGVSDLLRREPMIPGEQGTWVLDLPGDYQGYYYTYLVTVDGISREACDPYARSTGLNGRRAMILDLASTNPPGWEEDLPPFPVPSPCDAVICEVHLRDISLGQGSGIRHRGKFLGLAEEGTQLPDGSPTGLSHLLNLGITHVQLMPVYDFGSVDEGRPRYNWGYDPMNYNVPEGSYSTDPRRGQVRVQELKQLIAALHRNGLGVIMDVVYNHVYDRDGFCFNRIVPGYFSRPDSNGSGCGNDTATERAMVRKYIVDSLCYWAEEYHLDGFRLDLAGLIDVQTILQAMDAVRKRCPHVLFLGEGWTMDTRPTRPGTELATQHNSHLLPGFAFFNDTHRDLIRGSVFHTRDRGLAAGRVHDLDALRSCFLGVTPWAQAPGQSVNYISCHDNHTLHDRLALSLPEANPKELAQRCRLAAAFTLLSQGIPFFLAGEELLRSKPTLRGGYESNSYRSPDRVNAIRWENLSDPQCRMTRDYYRGLLAIRKAYPCLRLNKREEVLSSIKPLPCPNDRTLAFRLRSPEERMLCIFHCAGEPASFTLPDGEWQLLADGQRAGTDPLATLAGTIPLSPVSAMVLVQPRPTQIRNVAAALIWRDGKFLICQRPAHKARGLMWEFVGGKQEQGETLPQTLIRECREELDITVAPGQTYLVVEHPYPDIHIRLTLIHCTIAQGQPTALEHRDLRWIRPEEIPQYEFCPADKEILAKIRQDFLK